MSRFTVLAVLAFLLLTLATSVALAGGPDGVRFQLWAGDSPEPPTRDISFADCVLGSNLYFDTTYNTNLYIQKNGLKYSTYELPYPVDEWHPVTWYVIVEVNETSTLRMWSSAIVNPSIRYGVHGTDTTGAIVFHGPVYGDMITTTLGPGRYQFNTTASTVPEPSSLIAMFSGLIGLAGYGLRRHRQAS